MSISRQAIIDALSSVTEPDLKKDIVSLNLVKIVGVKDHEIHLTVRVSNPAMHSKMRMREAVVFAIERTLGKEFKVECDIIPIGSDERHGELRKVLPGEAHHRCCIRKRRSGEEHRERQPRCRHGAPRL